MADTARSKAALTTLYADNDTGAISPQDLRDGLVTWMGGYGCIYVEDGSTAQTGIGTSYTKMTGFAADGVSDNVTVAHGDDRITIDIPGVYMLAFTISFAGSVSTVFDFSLHVDQVEASPGLRVTRSIGTGGDTGSAGAVTMLSFAATNQLEIFVKADGTSKSITPSQAQFMVRLLG